MLVIDWRKFDKRFFDLLVVPDEAAPGVKSVILTFEPTSMPGIRMGRTPADRASISRVLSSAMAPKENSTEADDCERR